MKPVARISTRGYYDLLTGKTIKNNSYYLYPKQDFKKLIDSKELTIMIHGLRNDNAGAIAKVILAKNKLKKLADKIKEALQKFWENVIMRFINGLLDLLNEGIDKFAEALGITGTVTIGNA